MSIRNGSFPNITNPLWPATLTTAILDTTHCHVGVEGRTGKQESGQTKEGLFMEWNRTGNKRKQGGIKREAREQATGRHNFSDRTGDDKIGKHLYTDKGAQWEAAGLNHRSAGMRGKTNKHQVWLVGTMPGRRQEGLAEQDMTHMSSSSLLAVPTMR